MRKWNLLLALALVVVASLSAVAPARAHYDEGCTPGYWKQEQHFDSWVGYAPGDYFDAVFGVGPHITLLDGLGLNGGGENAMIRHAVAALLDASSDINYPMEVSGVINLVVRAYQQGRFEDAKNRFESANELGCPLN